MCEKMAKYLWLSARVVLLKINSSFKCKEKRENYTCQKFLNVNQFIQNRLFCSDSHQIDLGRGGMRVGGVGGTYDALTDTIRGLLLETILFKLDYKLRRKLNILVLLLHAIVKQTMKCSVLLRACASWPK